MSTELEDSMLADLKAITEQSAGDPPAPPPTAVPDPAAAAAAPPSAASATPPVGAAPEPAAPPSPPSVLDRLRGYGIQGDFDDEDKALEYLASRAKQAEQQAGWASLGIQFSELQKTPAWQNYVESLQQRRGSPPGQPAAVAPPAAPAGFQWQAPEFNPGWLNQVRYDDDNNLVSLPGADPTLPSKIQAWQEFLRNKSHDLFRDPSSFMEPLFEQKLQPLRGEFEQLVDRRVAAILAEQETRNFAQNTMQEVNSWAWQKDASGRVVTDAAGNGVMSADGYKYYEALRDLEALPPQKRHEYALRLVGRGSGSSAPTGQPSAAAPTPAPAAVAPPPPPTPAQLNEEAKRAFTDRIPPGGGYNPPRAGSFSGAGSLSRSAQEDDVVDESNLFDKMMADLRHQGAA